MTSPSSINHRLEVLITRKTLPPAGVILDKHSISFNPKPDNFKKITEALVREGIGFNYHTIDKHGNETLGYNEDSEIVRLVFNHNTHSMMQSFKIAYVLNQFSYYEDSKLVQMAQKAIGNYYQGINQTASDEFKIEYLDFITALKKIADNKAHAEDYDTALQTIETIDTSNFSDYERTNEYFDYEIKQFSTPIETLKQRYERYENKAQWKVLFHELHTTRKGESICDSPEKENVSPQALAAISHLPNDYWNKVLNYAYPEKAPYTKRYIEEQQNKSSTPAFSAP